jgi:nucleotide-binding universal stress UspA family protein
MEISVALPCIKVIFRVNFRRNHRDFDYRSGIIRLAAEQTAALSLLWWDAAATRRPANGWRKTMNILVAIDLSPASKKVIEAAHGIADLTGAAVYVLHVAEPEPDFVGYDAGPSVVRSQVAEELHREHRAVQAYAETLRDDGVDATALLVRGPTTNTTLKQASRLDAGMIIIGSHGHGAVYDVLVGSYSAGIIRNSKVPVLVVPVK